MAVHADQDATFAIIERHRELFALLDAAAAISGKFVDGPEFEAADAITAARRRDLVQHTGTLIRSAPTTMAGTLALTRYVASIAQWQLSEDHDPPEQTSPPTGEWHHVFLRMLADALERISQSAMRS
ncbi:hypothetical protein [Bradyrhizobium sp. 188]|uniref:hypothetical protein n=1 Tax=Bradyrhizobium sp. 188 TaxID=2782656 RepID=UPI001FF70FB8|nr:hypothetical protein [Bradyrhizobium sp. 188]MCK1501479.1 hypothetical protein [Bradyrhizobium sp. 188]